MNYIICLNQDLIIESIPELRVDVSTDLNAQNSYLLTQANYEKHIATVIPEILFQIKYENKKAIIQSKESRIDMRMKNLETEQSAINQMIQGIKSVRDDNISRYMKIFTG